MRGAKRTPRKTSKPTPKKLYSPSPGKQSDIRKFFEKTPPKKLLLPLLEEEPKVNAQRKVVNQGSNTMANNAMDNVKQLTVRPESRNYTRMNENAVPGPSASLTEAPTESRHISVSLTVAQVTTPRDVQLVPVETSRSIQIIFQQSKTIPIAGNCEDVTNAARFKCVSFMKDILGIGPAKTEPLVSGGSSLGNLEPEAPTCRLCGNHPNNEECPVDEEPEPRMWTAGRCFLGESIENVVEQPTENVEAGHNQQGRTSTAPDTLQSLREGGDVAGKKKKKSQRADGSPEANGEALTSAGRSLSSLPVKHEPQDSKVSVVCEAHKVKMECPAVDESNSRSLIASNARNEVAELMRANNVGKEKDIRTGRKRKKILQLESSQDFLSDISNTIRKTAKPLESSLEIADSEPLDGEEENIGTRKKRKIVQQRDSCQDANDDDDQCVLGLAGGRSLDSSQDLSDIGTIKKTVKPIESSLEIAENDVTTNSPGAAEGFKASRDGSDVDEDDDVTQTARKRRCRSTALESSDESGSDEKLVVTPRRFRKRVIMSGDEAEADDSGLDGTRTRRSTRVMSQDQKRAKERNAKLRCLRAKKSKTKRKLMASSSEGEGSESSASEGGYNTDGFVVSDSELPEYDSASSNSGADGTSDDDNESPKSSFVASADEAGEGSEGKKLVELEPHAGPSVEKEAESSLEFRDGEEGQRGREVEESSCESDSSSSEEEDSAVRLTDLTMCFDKAFTIYVDFLLAAALNPDLLSDRTSAGRTVMVAIKKVEDKVKSYRDSYVSSCWQIRFQRLLRMYPNYQVRTVQRGPAKCMACQRVRHVRSVVTLNGSPYNPTTLDDITEDESSDEDDVMEDTSAYDMAGCTTSREFVMGDHCHLKSESFHQLYHLEHWLYLRCRAKMETTRAQAGAEDSDYLLVKRCLADLPWFQGLLNHTEQSFRILSYDVASGSTSGY